MDISFSVNKVLYLNQRSPVFLYIFSLYIEKSAIIVVLLYKLFFSCCFQNFLFVFVFLQFNYDMYRCESLLFMLFGFVEILVNIDLYFSSTLWIFGHYFFTKFSGPFFLSSLSWTLIICTLIHLILSLKSLEPLYNFLQSFLFFLILR